MLSETYKGSKHDFAIFKDQSLKDNFPNTIPIYVDTGYQGINDECKDNEIYMPKKKPRNAELTVEEKSSNAAISRVRVRIEHSIGGAKKFNAVKDTCRAIKDSIRDKLIVCASGLWNFHLEVPMQDGAMI